MKNKYLSSLFLIVSIFFSNSFAFNSDGKKFALIDEFLSQLSQQGFSGSILVSDGTNVFKKGYGLADRENKIKVDENTVFTVGSVTKQFTGAAILKLEMQGKLSVTDTIDKYLKDVPADKKSITLHHLLTHSSGLPPQFGGDYDVLERDDFLEKTWKTPLLSKPGEKYEYSNIGYSVLSAIIEIVSKQTYEQYLHENLFVPAKMMQTGYKLPNWKSEQLSVGYRGENRWGKSTEKPWGKTGPYWNLLGNGGILSTTGDLYKWHQALLGDEILNKQAKEKYYKRHIEEGEGAGTFYGYGWALFPTPRNTTLITHNGGNGIFFCDFLRYIDEKVTIMMFTNSMRREFQAIPREIAGVFFRPDYKPVLNLQPAQTISSLDAHPNGKILSEFFKTISSGNKEVIEKFIKENFEPRFLNAVPMTQHLQVLTNIGNDIKDSEIDKILVSGERTTISYKNKPIKLNIRIENGKIGGLGLGD